MSLAQAITRHFNGDWHGTYGAFPAPGHSKGDRGMTVKDEPGAPDNVLIHSFNGDKQVCLEVKDQLRDIGILPPRHQSNDNAPRETGHYDYADRDGVVLYRTVRVEIPGQRKQFRAQHPDGRGGWAKGIGDAERVLYRFPEIAQAMGRAAMRDEPMPRVFLVEGERKADKLSSWGLLATSCAFGCKGWRKSYADDLAGCEVIILPDNDDEGRAFAERAANDIEKARGTATIVELPGLPEKGDIIDWTGSAEDLAQLVEQALNPPVATFPIADLAAWDGIAPQPKPFLMPGYIPARELTLATGAGGANKSTFGQQLATCIAGGVPMLGVDVVPGSALYITAEDDEDRLHWMQAHICEAVRVPMAALAGKLHLVSLRGRLGNELATFDFEGRLRTAPAFKGLRATIQKTGADLVVLDNSAHLFTGNESDRQQVTAFINLLYSLCRELGCTIILVAHTNKAGDTYSGSTAWLNAVRSQIVLERPENSPDPDERVLTLGKANYARQGQELRFRWHNFALISDADLPEDERTELAAVIRDNADNDIFLACLRERNRQMRAVSEKSGANYAPAIFHAMSESKHVGKARLAAAMDRLFRTGKIQRGELWRGDDRKMIFGLRETPKSSAGNAAANGAETRCANAANDELNHCNSVQQTRETYTPYTTYMEGGPLGAAPPSDDDVDWNVERTDDA